MNPSTLQRSDASRMALPAVIDIGTNSVKLLIAERKGGRLNPVWEGSRQTRLGRGLYKKNLLQQEAILQTADAVAEFVALCRKWTDQPPRVIATSAAREARNKKSLVSAIKQRTGLKTEIISGEQEAKLVFKGVSAHLPERIGGVLVLDVGGGSTEFILGIRGISKFARSFPLGSVRMLEEFKVSDPPTPLEFQACQAFIHHFILAKVAPTYRRAVARLRLPAIRLVGSGGAGTILAMNSLGLRKFDRDRIEGVSLSRSRVLRQVRTLWAASLAKRAEFPGVPHNRADVILMGSLIYASVMDALDFSSLQVSTRGLRFGAFPSSSKKK